MLLESAPSTATSFSLAAMSAERIDVVELYAFALLLGYVLHVLCVAGLFIRRGHPAWLGLAFGLLPLVGLAVAVRIGDASRLRQQEREGLHLVAAAQTSNERSRFLLRALLLVGIGVVVLLFLDRGTHRLDLTEGQRYTLDPVTQRLLAEVQRYEPVLRVRYYYSPADVRPQRFATMPREMRDLLDEYKRFGGERFEYHLVEVPQLGHDTDDEFEEEFDDLGLFDLDIEEEEEESDEPEREHMQILREVRDLGIEPIHDEVVDGGRAELVRYYSALHVSYGPAGEEVLDEITVSRQRAEAGQRAVDIANWELTRAIVMLMDRSINLTQPFQIRTFGIDGERVRLAGVDGFVRVGDEVRTEEGARFRLAEVDAEMRRIELEPLDTESAEPVEVFRVPTFRYRIGLLEGHGENHDDGSFVHHQFEDYGFEIEHVNLQGGREPVPEEIDVLLMTSTAEALPERVRYEVDRFLMKGGRVLYTYSAMEPPHDIALARQEPWRGSHDSWRTLTEPYGMRLGEGFVFDNQCFRVPEQGAFLPLALHLRPENFGDHPLRAGIVASDQVDDNLTRLWIYGVPVRPRGVTLTEEVRFREALRSSDEAWVQPANNDILRDPLGFGTARRQGSNPFLSRLLVRNEAANESFPLAASVEGRFESAFAGVDVPDPASPVEPPAELPEGIPGLPEGFDGQGQPEEEEAFVPDEGAFEGEEAPVETDERERYERAIAEGRLMVFGSNWLYPYTQRPGDLEIMENALLYLIPDGEELLGLKAKTTAYTPIEAALSDNDRTWYTAMVTLMVPIGLLIVAVLVMLAERAEQMFFRARQQARRRGTAATSPFSRREIVRRQFAGGGVFGLGLLMVLMGTLGWLADPRSSVMWLLAFVLALPLCGYGLEQLAALRGSPSDESETEPRGYAYGLIPLAFGLVIVGFGLLLLASVENFEPYRDVMGVMRLSVWILALGMLVAGHLVQRSQASASAAAKAAPGGAAESDAIESGAISHADDGEQDTGESGEDDGGDDRGAGTATT